MVSRWSRVHEIRFTGNATLADNGCRSAHSEKITYIASAVIHPGGRHVTQARDGRIQTRRFSTIELTYLVVFVSLLVDGGGKASLDHVVASREPSTDTGLPQAIVHR